MLIQSENLRCCKVLFDMNHFSDTLHDIGHFHSLSSECTSG